MLESDDDICGAWSRRR